MTDCYRCKHWDYFNDDPETHEGYGFCRNPESPSFGQRTEECNDGCDEIELDKADACS